MAVECGTTFDIVVPIDPFVSRWAIGRFAMANDFFRRAFGFGKLILILSVIAIPACSRRVISVKQVDRMIRDQVPIGSDKQNVKDFIDNLQVDSLKIGRDADFHRQTCFRSELWIKRRRTRWVVELLSLVEP
jgi:hypothetical protein